MAWQRPLATVSRAVSCGRSQSVSTVLVLRPFSLHCRQTTLSLQFCIQKVSPSSGLRAALRSRVPVPRSASSSLPAMRKGAMTRRLELAMLLLLTFSTGMVDAIGYLGFVTVFLGNIGETWQRRTTLIFASVAVGCAGLSLYVGLMPNPEVGLAGTIFTSALSALMGAQAAAARRMKIADVTTVVVTSTIVGLASDSRLAGGDSTRWVRRVLAVTLILTGALAGAATLMLNQWIGIAVVAVII